MESGQSSNVSIHQHLMTPINEANQVRSHNDIMIRRLKNRERQRRYRARKRLEAESKRDQTSQLLEFHGADLRDTHTPVYLPQDSHVVSQRNEAGSSTQSGLIAIEMPINDTPQNFPSRVHCRRDWKKDARRVHLHKDQAVRSKDNFALEQTAAGEKQMPPFSTQINADPPMVTEVQQRAPLQDNDGTRRAVPSRRHWKAEARNKKS